MRLLIIVPGQDRATGNHVTAERLARQLAARGHQAMVGTTDLAGTDLSALIRGADPDRLLLLHAYRSGRPWLEACGGVPPALVLLTGTDLHGGLPDPVQGPVIDAVLLKAKAVLIQNPLAAATLRNDRPDLADRLHYLPPGVELGSTPWPLRGTLGIGPEVPLLLCPAGIRPVKGVLELLLLCNPLAQEGRNFRLAFCGPVLDEDYGARFRAALAERPWAVHLGVIPPDAMGSALAEADLVLNNSFTEGLSNALAEAAVLGRPILARDIPGNAAVVAPGVNGLLYRDADGFYAAATLLLGSPSARAALSRPDPERFSPAREAAVLESILQASLV